MKRSYFRVTACVLFGVINLVHADIPRIGELLDQGRKLQAAGKHQDSQKPLQEAVKLIESRGDDQESYAGPAYAYLANAFVKGGEPGLAVGPARKATEIAKREFGPGNSNVIKAERVLANCLLASGNLLAARDLYVELAAHYRKNSPASADEAAMMTSIGHTYVHEQDHENALRYYSESLKMFEALGSAGKNGAADSRHALAGIYKTLGEYDRAERDFKLVLAMDEEAGRGNSQGAGSTMNVLAQITARKGSFSEALVLQEKALEIVSKIEGGTGAGTAATLVDYSTTLAQAGQTSKAESTLKRAIAMYEGALPPGHFKWVTAKYNLGRLQVDAGRLDAAAAIFEQILRNDKASVETRNGCGYWLGLLYAKKGKVSEATKLAEMQLEEGVTKWERLAAFATAQQRRSARATFHPFGLPATLGSGSLLAKATVSFKALALDADLQESRQAALSANDPAWKRLREVRARLALLEFSGEIETPNGAAEARNLEQEAQRIHLKLNRPRGSSSALSPSATLTKVRNSLDPTAAVLDYVRYNRWISGLTEEDRYAVVVITRDQEPVFVDLGLAEPLEKKISDFRRIAASELSGAPEAEIKAANQKLDRLSQSIHNAIIAPVMNSLEGKKKCYVCPDGDLHFVPFGVLKSKSGVLFWDEFQVQVITTARDLIALNPENKIPTKGKIVLVGNPDYNAVTSKSTNSLERGAPISRQLNGNLRRFGSLPGTAAEVELLQRRISGTSWKSTPLVSGAATEQALRQQSAPLILHLATHGYFLPKTENPTPSNSFFLPSGLQDPMLRAGLVFAGVNRTISQWAAGANVEPRMDGVLTAAEAAELPLQSTFLVTLSACETALGDSASGEDVLGFKRAFNLAGTEHLLITLWPISDAETVALMDAFYGEVFSGVPPQDALRKVQQAAFTRVLKEKGMYFAINYTAPFQLVSWAK